MISKLLLKAEEAKGAAGDEAPRRDLEMKEKDIDARTPRDSNSRQQRSTPLKSSIDQSASDTHEKPEEAAREHRAHEAPGE